MDEEEMVQAEDSYFPDFSDIYNESFGFWDFMSQKEISKKNTEPFVRIFDDTSDEEGERNTIPSHSFPKRDEEMPKQDSHPFWDFLSSRTENVKHSCSLGGDFFSPSDDKVEENPHRETYPHQDVKVQKSDEFWDFLNSSTATASLPCSSSREETPGALSLPRISSVFSVKSDETPEIHQWRSSVNNSKKDLNIAYDNPYSDQYCTDAKSLELENSVELNTAPQAIKSPAHRSSLRPASVSKYSANNAPPFVCQAQYLGTKEESVDCTTLPVMVQNLNSSTEPLYVLLPNSEPNYSQYFIIVNNVQPQTLIGGGGESPKIPKQSDGSSERQKCSKEVNDNFESDLHLAGFRNNHVFNICNKRCLESPLEPSESKCSLPVSSTPLNNEILNSISTRVKCEQSSGAKTVNKQVRRTGPSGSVRRKPIKCISLGSCKNAIQQTNTPISLEAFETEHTLLKSCSGGTSKVDGKTGEVHSDKTPYRFKTSVQINSFLPITFARIPISNEKQSTSNPAEAPTSLQAAEIDDLYKGPSRCLLLSGRTSLPQKVLILKETRQNKIILPKPPLKQKRVAPKCRRKTVKELLQERQQQFEHACREPESDVHCDDPKNDIREGSHERSLRPRHYDMSELQIGVLKVKEEDDEAHGRFRSKFKVLFMKRQFVYYFPVCRCNQPSLKTWEGEWAKITVPFKSVTSISMKDRLIYLNVDSTPRVSLENDRFTEDTRWVHFLQGSLGHKVVLRKRQASKLKSILCQFDERFISLANITSWDHRLAVDPLSFKKRFCKNRKCRRLPLNDKSLLLNQMCSCRTNCRSIRCSCVKAAKSCSSRGCHCTNCNNPLNVLEAIGLDIKFSLKDSCLFQNIYQIPDLSNYLLREVRLDCCNGLARVQDCVPGTVLCPNCNTSLEYSWCQKTVSYPERDPRNHCSFCGQCCFSNGRHCHVCKKCYAVTSKSKKCPTCPMESQRSLNTFCYDKKLCTSSKPQIIVLDPPSSTSGNALKLPEDDVLHCSSETKREEILKQYIK